VPSDFVLRRVDEANTLDYVGRLLSWADLPTAGVRERAGAFRVATVDGERVGVGVGGRHGRYGLVRSVVVEPSARGEGLGAGLVAALADEAEAAGVDRLFLLTTDAVAFFATQGSSRWPGTRCPGRSGRRPSSRRSVRIRRRSCGGCRRRTASVSPTV
jgi:amino-acid N-acetyltransferase